MNHSPSLAAPAVGLRDRWNRLADHLSGAIWHALLALVARVSIAAIFFLSGRTKVEGLLEVTDAARALFRDEFKVPLLPPDFAASLTAYAEHLFPVLLVLGFLPDCRRSHCWP